MQPGIRLPGASSSNAASGPGAFNSQGGAPTFNTDLIQGLLAHFGVQLPSSFSDAGPFEQAAQGDNSPASKLLGGHPQVGHAIDNALITAALTKQGRTPGEGISNVAQGLLGVQPYRREVASSQAQSPLEFAKAIGGLQQQDAMAQMYSGLGDIYRQNAQANLIRAQSGADKQEWQANVALMRAQVESNKAPRIGTNGVVQTWQWSDPANPLSGGYRDEPGLDPQEIRRQTERQQGGAAFQTWEGMRGPMPDPTRNPDAYTKWWTDFHDQKLKDQLAVSRSNFGMRQDANPSVTDTANKLFQGSQTEIATNQKNLDFSPTIKKSWQTGKRDQILQQGWRSPDGRITIAPGDISGSRAAAAGLAQQEEQRLAVVRGQIAQSGSEYQKMILSNPEQAAQFGSFGGYLLHQGYDYNSKTFSQPPAQNNPASNPAQAPNPMQRAPQQSTKPNDPLGIF